MKRFTLLLFIQILLIKGYSQQLQELAIDINGDTIRGTLVLPKNNGKAPLMLLQAGSGPTDRFGNSTLGVTTNAYRMLADSLAKNGIATWLYDKRMIGASYKTGTKESDLLFSNYVDDMAAMGEYFIRDKRFSKIFLAGHSEGSLIAGAAAKKFPQTAGVISIAGPGYRIDSILVKQITAQNAQLGHITDSLYQRILNNEPVDTVNIFLQSMFRPSIRPYLKDWAGYSPCIVYGSLKQPVLIINGTADIQVEEDNALRLKACNPAAELVIIDGMNHVLKNSSKERAENLKTYNQPDLPLNKELSQSIINFIRKHN